MRTIQTPARRSISQVLSLLSPSPRARRACILAAVVGCAAAASTPTFAGEGSAIDAATHAAAARALALSAQPLTGDNDQADRTDRVGEAPDDAPPSAPADAAQSPAPDAGDEPPFLIEGGDWLSIQSGVAFTTDNTDYNLRLNYHRFLADEFEFNAAVGGWFHDQEGEEANGGSDESSLAFDIGFRWHLLHDDAMPAGADPAWTAYLDTGIGTMFSTGDVPAGGTTFNFTPRAGGGATIKLGDSRARLDLGVRWQHYSNGSSSGSDDNPSRDSVMVYAGVVFPF